MLSPLFLLHIALRPERREDEAFLLEVYASTREEELNATGWPAEARRAFLNMQFGAMRRGYQSMFPAGEFSIILLNERPVGQMVVDRGAAEIRLVDVALLPAYRAQGIGTFLISRLLAEAESAKKPVVLQVLPQNRAACLYQRLGFQLVAQAGAHLKMQWRATTPSSGH